MLVLVVSMMQCRVSGGGLSDFSLVVVYANRLTNRKRTYSTFGNRGWRRISLYRPRKCLVR